MLSRTVGVPLVVSTGFQGLDSFLQGGYPDGSAILLTGPPGVGKEALGYWFIDSGLKQGDFCLYVTHRPVSHVLRDMKAFGLGGDLAPDWVASVGSQHRCDINDPTGISFNVKQLVERNKGRRVRIVTDVLSPLLVLNPLETMYRYWTQLITEVRKYDAVLLATEEEGMHPQNLSASMEQLFDGVIEMKLFENGLSFTPLLRVKKMLGAIPQAGYYRFSLAKHDLEILTHVK